MPHPPYHRQFQPAPQAVVTNGQFNFGIYNEPLQSVNLLDARKPYGIPLPSALQYMRLKEWQAFQLGNEDYFILAAIYNAKTMALAQFIIFDIKNNTKTKYEQKVPLWKIDVGQGMLDSVSEYRSKSFSLKSTNKLSQGTITLEVETNGFKGLPNLKGSFTGQHVAGKVSPQVVVMPFGDNRGMYSHKCLMPMEGVLHMGGKTIGFEKGKSHLIVDDHKGYYPYTMQYDWITGAGFNQQGQMVGFNLTDNQVLNPEVYNENCLWVDGQIHLLPPIKVTRPSGVEGQWLISDRYGQVSLQFNPVANTRVDVNLLFIRSDYHGPYGFFKGFIKDDNGNEVVLDGLFGMGEQFYLRA
ncbi:DUF2804 domain-containing protein [soil metagenome]